MKSLTRRDVILGGASLAALGGATAYTRAMRLKDTVRETGPEIPAFIPERDLKGLSHPMTAYAKIGNVELSRLILGGNMIGGWAHSRDMAYGRLVKAYFTDERVFRNFRIAEAFISDCGNKDGVIKGAIVSVENGASMVYFHGGHADNNAHKGNWKAFREYLDESRKLGVPVGIGCHSLKTVKFCVEHDCLPDFWMKTVHRVDYPTAHLNEDKKKPSPIGLGVCDNRFVDTTREEVFEYMASRPEPWIAFKVLGAGIEHPRDAFPVSWKGGADFICCGMYDYQVVEDVNVTNDVFANGLPQRASPWHG